MKKDTEYSFVTLLDNFFKQKGFLTEREVAAGYGRADLVLGKLNKSNIKIRNVNNQSAALLNEKYFEVLRNLPDIHSTSEPLHIAQLIDKISFSPAYLKRKIISYLEENGYVKRVEGNLLYKVNGWLPIAKEIIAVEAKLTDWKRGILQANRYKSFADKVYLALPERSSHLVNTQLLLDLNVGLYVLNSSGRVIEKVKAKRATETVLDKKNLVSELLWFHNSTT